MSFPVDPSVMARGVQSLSQTTGELVSDLKVINLEVKQDAYVNLLNYGALSQFRNLMPDRKKMRKLFPRKKKAKSLSSTEESHSDVHQTGESTKERAARYHADNEELDEQFLLALQQQIGSGDDPEAILEKIKDYFQDWALVDQVLEFLAESASPELQNKLANIKENIHQKYGREIIAGRNMGNEARFFSKHGLGSPMLLRKMYLDITANPRTAPDLFQELSNRFSYGQTKKLLGFLLKSLGADLRSKGPSISSGELFRLITETRTAQAILGVYRFFKGREQLVHRLFSQQNIKLDQGLTFDNMAKSFMRFVMDRFPSKEGLRNLLGQLGAHNSLFSLIVLGMQMRDALRNVDPYKLFGNGNDEAAALLHKEELKDTILLLLEDLEDEYEEFITDYEEEGEKHSDQEDNEEEDENLN